VGKNNFLRPSRLFFRFRRPQGGGFTGAGGQLPACPSFFVISFLGFASWIYGLNLVKSK